MTVTLLGERGPGGIDGGAPLPQVGGRGDGHRLQDLLPAHRARVADGQPLGEEMGGEVLARLLVALLGLGQRSHGALLGGGRRRRRGGRLVAALHGALDLPAGVDQLVVGGGCGPQRVEGGQPAHPRRSPLGLGGGRGQLAVGGHHGSPRLVELGPERLRGRRHRDGGECGDELAPVGDLLVGLRQVHLEGGEARRGLVELAEQRGQLRDPLPAGGHRLGGGAAEPVELLVGQAHRSLGRGGTAVGLLGHPLVDAEVEQGDQQLLAVGGTVVQEAGELALGQHHAAGEVGERQAEDLLDRGRHLLGPPGQHAPVGRLQPGLLRGDPAVRGPAARPGRRRSAGRRPRR